MSIIMVDYWAASENGCVIPWQSNYIIMSMYVELVRYSINHIMMY